MKPISWLGVALLIAGIVILSGKITYTRDAETVSVGPVELVTKRKSGVPPWLGVLVIVGGGALLVVGARRT